MEFEEFKEYLLSKNEEAKNRTLTEQYRISRLFLNHRINNSLTPVDMAKMLEIDIDTYISIESGDIDVPLETITKYLKFL